MRNHKKIIVVDDRVAYCGGMNIADDYAGLRLGTGLFRDTQLRVRGPGVRDLAALVLRSMRDVAGEAPGIGAAPEPLADGSFAQVLASDVRRDVRAIQKALRYTVLRAGERCYLSSPYFVPQARLMRALRKAARRGVDVRVLTAGRSDVPLVTLASRHLYGRLIRAGVRIWEMQGQTLHAKTVSIDGVYGGVGSFNLDRWSARRNLEVGVGFLDRPVAGELERSFLADLEGSEEVGLERWSRRGALARFVSWLAYWIVRL
jgi:cardiolipin synthase